MKEEESRLQPGIRVIGVQAEAKELEKLTPPVCKLTASGPEHLMMPAATCPFPWTPPLTLGGGTPGGQMPISMGAGGLRKRIFIWGTQPVCLMGEGLVVSTEGPDS